MEDLDLSNDWTIQLNASIIFVLLMTIYLLLMDNFSTDDFAHHHKRDLFPLWVERVYYDWNDDRFSA